MLQDLLDNCGSNKHLIDNEWINRDKNDIPSEIMEGFMDG
jgi:hypothetical protein